MIDQENTNFVIVEKLKEVTGCEVVKSNLSNAPLPIYPYISFTILNTDTKKGTYGTYGTGRFIGLTQTWSFTVQSDKDSEAQRKAMLAKDWLEEAGRVYLADHGIVVQSAGPISNRDTLLSVQYEYRKGFDTVFSLVNEMQEPEMETIEHAEIKKE